MTYSLRPDTHPIFMRFSVTARKTIGARLDEVDNQQIQLSLTLLLQICGLTKNGAFR
jgi:hypothetical protein